jgi:uncharacterized protein (UPF0332 family)
MSDPARALFDKAKRAIHAAEVLLKDGEADFAVGRAYYAMLYVAEALLIAKGLRFRKHGSVHAAFGEHFTKEGVLDPKFHRWLLDAYDQRILGDYGVDVTLTGEDAVRVIQQAREFLQAVRSYLSAA